MVKAIRSTVYNFILKYIILLKGKKSSIISLLMFADVNRIGQLHIL